MRGEGGRQGCLQRCEGLAGAAGVAEGLPAVQALACCTAAIALLLHPVLLCSPRLALVDLDWGVVRAVDILAALNSFKPKVRGPRHLPTPPRTARSYAPAPGSMHRQLAPAPAPALHGPARA